MGKILTPAAVLARAKLKKTKSKFIMLRISAAARKLGMMGGLAGGPARAEALTDAERTEIATHAANVRWGNPSNYTK